MKIGYARVSTDDQSTASQLMEDELQEKSPKAALTELFLELKTDETPAVVERIVADIDAIVRIVNFPGWQNTIGGEREKYRSHFAKHYLSTNSTRTNCCLIERMRISKSITSC